MLTYKRSSTNEELQQILELQQKNLPSNLVVAERKQEGFVTVSHTLGALIKLNDTCPHIIAKDSDKVVGYALCLCMHPDFSEEIEVLKPMFLEINLLFQKTVSYMVMGQICIDKAYRKKGVFRGMYNFYREELYQEFDCLITTVASKNTRSLNAHRTIGFEAVKSYRTDNVSWELLKWDWN